MSIILASQRSLCRSITPRRLFNAKCPQNHSTHRQDTIHLLEPADEERCFRIFNPDGTSSIDRARTRHLFERRCARGALDSSSTPLLRQLVPSQPTLLATIRSSRLHRSSIACKTARAPPYTVIGMKSMATVRMMAQTTPRITNSLPPNFNHVVYSTLARAKPPMMAPEVGVKRFTKPLPAE